jgi:peptide/nickel transport system substrate-binding protein
MQRSSWSRGGVAAAAFVCAVSVALAAAGPASAQPSARSATPRRGGSVTWGLEAETTGGYCLPNANLAISGIMVVNAIYDTLTTLNDKGQYVPYLAQSVTPNATDDQWTIKLRPNVTFQDGEPVDAAAVKLNLDSYRGVNPKIRAPLNSFVLANVASVTVADPLTVVVATKTPWPAFPAYLFQGGRTGILAPAQLSDPATCATNMIGSGPFKLQEWRPNEHLIAVRNPNYWRKGLPYLDKLTFEPVPDGPTRINDLEGGQINVMHTSGAEEQLRLRDLAKQGQVNETESAKGSEVTYLMLNSSKPPFDDPLARQIVVYSRNTAEINQIRNHDLYPLASGPFPPGSIGYLKDSGMPKPDPKKARALEKQYEAKYGHPLQFEYLTGPEPELVAIGELIQQNASKYGVKVSVRTEDQSSVINDALAGSYTSVGWRNHPGGDPDLQYVWWKGGSPVNVNHFNDPVINQLLDQGRVETDPAKRAQIYQDLNRQFGKEMYSSWSWQATWTVAAAKNVHGVLGPPLPDGHGKPFPIFAGYVPVVGEWVGK